MPGQNSSKTEQLIRDLAVRHRDFADKLASRQSIMIPVEDPDFEAFGEAFPAWAEPRRDAILQPSRPQIQPSGQILERIAGRDLDTELTD